MWVRSSRIPYGISKQNRIWIIDNIEIRLVSDENSLFERRRKNFEIIVKKLLSKIKSNDESWFLFNSQTVSSHLWNIWILQTNKQKVALKFGMGEN